MLESFAERTPETEWLLSIVPNTESHRGWPRCASVL
jgi:hypothetical protein